MQAPPPHLSRVPRALMQTHHPISSHFSKTSPPFLAVYHLSAFLTVPLSHLQCHHQRPEPPSNWNMTGAQSAGLLQPHSTILSLLHQLLPVQPVVTTARRKLYQNVMNPMPPWSILGGGSASKLVLLQLVPLHPQPSTSFNKLPIRAHNRHLNFHGDLRMTRAVLLNLSLKMVEWSPGKEKGSMRWAWMIWSSLLEVGSSKTYIGWQSSNVIFMHKHYHYSRYNGDNLFLCLFSWPKLYSTAAYTILAATIFPRINSLISYGGYAMLVNEQFLEKYGSIIECLNLYFHNLISLLLMFCQSHPPSSVS